VDDANAPFVCLPAGRRGDGPDGAPAERVCLPRCQGQLCGLPWLLRGARQGGHHAPHSRPLAGEAPCARRYCQCATATTNTRLYQTPGNYRIHLRLSTRWSAQLPRCTAGIRLRPTQACTTSTLCSAPACPAQLWRYEGGRTLSYYLKRRDTINALAEDLEVEPEQVVPTVMKQIFESLNVSGPGWAGSWEACWVQAARCRRAACCHQQLAQRSSCAGAQHRASIRQPGNTQLAGPRWPAQQLRATAAAGMPSAHMQTCRFCTSILQLPQAMRPQPCVPTDLPHPPTHTGAPLRWPGPP
jgi:hypothetical protein